VHLVYKRPKLAVLYRNPSKDLVRRGSVVVTAFVYEKEVGHPERMAHPDWTVKLEIRTKRQAFGQTALAAW
jgi:hypothetical protein